MNTPKEIKVRVLDEVVTVLDYGKGRFVAKAGGGSLDTEQGKIRHLAELQAVELLAATYRRKSNECDLEKSQQHLRVLLPDARAYKEVKEERVVIARKGGQGNTEPAEMVRQAVKDWVDTYLAARKNTRTPSARYLAEILLESVGRKTHHNTEGFKWPEGCKPRKERTIREIIYDHLSLE